MSEAEGGVEGRVLVVGDVMTDVIVRPEGPLVRGSDRRAAITTRPGGSGANQAVWLGAMGTRTAFVARVAAGDKPQLEAYFRGLGVEPLLVGDAEHPSGMLVTIVDADGERSFLTDRGANLSLSQVDLPEALLEGTRLVVVSGYSLFAELPRAAVRGLAGAARSCGIPVVVDAASVAFIAEVGAENFLAWTTGFSILFANEEEAAALSGAAGVEEQMTRLAAGYGLVVIKRGALGAVAGDCNGVKVSLPAPRVDVVDTTGAGDAFAAGFLSTQLAGGELEACLRRGIEAGSAAVTRLGGQPGG